jgi:hypothetical protein
VGEDVFRVTGLMSRCVRLLEGALMWPIAARQSLAFGLPSGVPRAVVARARIGHLVALLHPSTAWYFQDAPRLRDDRWVTR